MLVRFSRRFAVAVILGGVAAGCSASADLSADDRTLAAELVEQRAMDASIDLSEEDLGCVVDRMSPDDLDLMRSDQVGTVADFVVSCVGEDLIGRSVLRSQAAEISDESLTCAIEELDRRFVVDLVTGAMNDDVPRAPVEIELARVLSVCLELDELL